MPSSSEQSLVKQAKILKLDRQCRDDPKLFFSTFLWTFDPKHEPYHFPFEPFPFENDLIDNIVSHIENGIDLFIDKCREMGVTYTILGVLFWYWKYQAAANFLIGSRVEKFVDNTGESKEGEVSNKEESLFGKLDYMIERIPPLVLPEGFDVNRHRSNMSLRNPQLGNVIGGESSNANFSRGGRQRAILLDEFAFWENDVSAWGSTADTTNCRIVATTPGNRPNTKAKRLRFGTDEEKIDIVTLPYYLNPNHDEVWVQRQKERRSSEDFAREIMIDWEGSTAGVVYREAKMRTVGSFPYRPNWPLFISWDFGLDGLAIQWWQYDMTRGRHLLLDAYMNADKPIQWYFPLLGKPIDSKFQYEDEALDAIDRTKYYLNAVHYGDPDVAKRSLLTGTSTHQALEEIGVYVQTNTMANDFISRREKTKILLQGGFDVNKTPGTEMWMECIDNARYPQRQETSQATASVNLPIHDWTSHHRTTTEYYAVNFVDPSIPKTAVGFVLPSEPNYTGDREGVLVLPDGQIEAAGLHIDVQSMVRRNNRNDSRDWRSL